MPVTSAEDICNLALTDLGHGQISAIGENTKAGRLTALWYPVVRDATLRSHPWNCAVKRAELAREDATPSHEYTYQYALPDDCLKVIRTDLEAESYVDVDYRIEGRKLLTNEGTVFIEYIARIEDVSLYDDLLVLVIAKSLAVAMCMSLTDNASLRTALQSELQNLAPQARSADAQEGIPRDIQANTWLYSRL